VFIVKKIAAAKNRHAPTGMLASSLWDYSGDDVDRYQ